MHDDIFELFGRSDVILESIKRDKKATTEFTPEEVIKNCQDELFRTIRKGDRVSDESIANLIPSMLFHKKHYNLSATGRYMLNIKLNLVDRISGTILGQDLVIKDKNGEEISLKIGTPITHKLAVLIQ